jgi:hypothetical protein
MEELVVRLRPFEEADLVCFDRFANDPEYSPFEWTGYHSSQSWRLMWVSIVCWVVRTVSWSLAWPMTRL